MQGCLRMSVRMENLRGGELGASNLNWIFERGLIAEKPPRLREMDRGCGEEARLMGKVCRWMFVVVWDAGVYDYGLFCGECVLRSRLWGREVF